MCSPGFLEEKTTCKQLVELELFVLYLLGGAGDRGVHSQMLPPGGSWWIKFHNLVILIPVHAREQTGFAFRKLSDIRAFESKPLDALRVPERRNACSSGRTPSWPSSNG